MKFALSISLLPYLIDPEILAKEKAVMVEEMEVQETEDMIIILVDKGKIQRPVYIIMF